MRVINDAAALVEHGTDCVSCDIVALLEGGCGERLVEEQQTALRRALKDTPEPPALLAEPSELHRFILIRREVREYTIDRLKMKAIRRHGDASLRQEIQLADGLCDRGLAAAVRSGQDVDPVLRQEI